MKGLCVIFLAGLLVVPSVYSQWTYVEKLHLMVGSEIVEAGANYETFYGEGGIQIGGKAQGVLDSKNEDAWSALALLKFSNEFEAVTLGAGFQQRDPSVSSSPVVELALTLWYDGLSRTQVYGQYELDGVGAGVGLRLEWTAEISNRLDVDLFLDASWFEDLEEDLDGYVAVFAEPSAEFNVLHLGPALWLDEEDVAIAFMVMIRP